MSLRQSTSNEAIISATTSSATISSNLSKESNETEFSEGGYFCQGTGHYENLASQMFDYWKDNKLCDVTLIAGIDNRHISAHRVVLSAASPYFGAMFCGNLREATEQEITLQEMEGDSLFQLIQYCYTGTSFSAIYGISNFLCVLCGRFPCSWLRTKNLLCTAP